jgi:phage terminase small subunit
MASAKKQILTEKQENFALTYVVNGRNASDAYRAHYSTDNMLDTTVWRNAHELRHSSKVSARIHELIMQTTSKRVLGIEERRAILSDMIIQGDTKAMDILNKMDGIYIEKKQVEHSGQIIQRNIIVNPTKDK